MSTGFVLNIPQEMINRLDLADQKIEKIAKTSEDSRNRIIAAFQQVNTQGIDAFIQRLDVAQQKLAALGGTQINMGVNANTSGFQQLIDAINNLSQASKTNITINGLGTVGNQTQTAIDAINKLMATLQQLQQMGGQQFLGGVNNLGRQTLREMNKEARKMEKTMTDLDAAIQKYGISATDLANKLQQARQAQQQFNDTAKQQAQSDVSGLIGMKGQQTTLNELKNYANELKRTMANLDPKSQEWKKLNDIYKQTNREIKNIQNSMKDVQKQSRSLMDISGQLARKLALVFSVSQITGYVKKLIEVRGEFELQQRSLQAILQDKDKANEVWQKTVDLAVRSPFRVKELVSYTKQLAAYRIESDKLFETNKMLADISAGLGVDMQRLILAFGQVRSAAYLRGTELRQFTEAGIPILEQLAKYFTELEGRAVSVGDVFERVSKRMVSFADVEEIFKRMTAEGGTFYRMQEIQAETLKGMWSNLKDSVDIMVNEIGKGNESTLKNSLALVKQLVDNWRKVKPVIETVGISFITYFGADVLRKIGRGFKALWTTISAHPILAAVSAVALLITYIWRAREAQNALNAAMSDVENENLKSLEENIALYHKLRDAINDVTKSSEDREKAYKQLESTFDSILPQEYLAKEYVEDLSKGYKEAEKAMTDYYDAKTQAQKKDRIEGLYAKELDTDISELITSVRSRIETRRDIPEAMKSILQSGVSGIVNNIIEEVKNGDLANDIDTIADEIQKRLEKYAAIELPRTQAGEGVFRLHDVKDIIGTLGEYKDALEDIQGLPYETHGQKVASEWLNKEKESLQQISDIYKKLLSLYSKYSKATDEDKVKIADDISLAMSQVPEKLNAYLPLLQESVDKMKGIAEKGAFEFTASMQTLESDFVEGLVKVVKHSRIDKQIEGAYEGIDYTALFDFADNLQEGIKTASDKLDMTPFQNAVVGGARQIAERFGQDVNIFEKFIPNQKEALSNVRQEVKAQIESFETQISEMQVSLTQGMFVLSEDVLNNTKETIKSMTDQLPALKAFLAFLGEIEKEKGRKEKTIDERIKVVDQMNAKYKELNKTLSKTESLQGAFDAYKDAFATAYDREDVRQMSAEDFAKNVLNFPDEDAVIAWLDNLANTVADKEDKFKVQMAKGKFEMDVKVRLKQEDDQELLDDIQKLFDRYDLSLDLKKLNIPPDFAKSLFGVDYLDLNGLKKAVQEQEAKFIGTDMEKEYKDFLDKIDDLHRKQQEENAKRFVEFMADSLDETRVILEQKGIDVAFAKSLFDAGKINAGQFAEVVKNIIAQSNEEISKFNLDKFKESPQYIQAMGDLTAYTTAEIKKLIKSLEDVVSANSEAFSADEAEAYINATYNAQARLDELEKSPFRWETFANIGDILETEREIDAQKEEKIALQEKEKTQLEELVRLEEKLKRLQEEKNAIISEGGDLKSKSDRLAGVQSDIDATTQAIQSGQQAVAATQSQAKTTETILGKLGDKMKGLTGKGGGAASAVAIIDAIVNGINDTVQGILDITNEIGSVMESFGKETDMSTGFGKFQKGFAIFAESSQHAADGWNALKNGDPVGAVVSVVKSVTSLIRGINEYKDANFQVEIDRQVKIVEGLSKAYEKLEKASEKAYSIQQLQQANAELERNVELQKASYRAMISAERAKKNTDEEQIEEWNEDLETLTQQLDDLKKNLLEGGGGVSEANYRSQTRQFVDSWVSAFQETGDGLQGLEDNFTEFFDNIIAEQAAIRVTEKFLEPFYESLNKSLEDYKLTAQESKDLREMVEKIAPDLSAALEKIWGQLGGSGGAEAGGLSALQKGIQGITEETAQVLESLLNSMRFYVADSNAKLTQLLNNMMSGETESSMLAELRAQTKWMRDIYNLIDGMTTTHPSGGRGIKAIM